VKSKLIRLGLVFITFGSAAYAQTTTYTDADAYEAFKVGIALQCTFEMGGMLVRFLRSMRASSSVDLGG